VKNIAWPAVDLAQARSPRLSEIAIEGLEVSRMLAESRPSRLSEMVFRSKHNLLTWASIRAKLLG